MTLQEHLNQVQAFTGALVYGEPHETSDGTTIITASRVGGFKGGLRPLGIFVVRGDQVKWEPAVDAGRIAMLGVLTGLIAATLGTLAVVKRPPWPDLRITISKHQ
ncbi:hypothetical protein [Nocardia sp. NBC_00511]|uniref:hypothetical protein n=1 Tax=Nocardia sp. NBC_00511 TaxID=2903591 RepID=UPI0030DFE5A2